VTSWLESSSRNTISLARLVLFCVTHADFRCYLASNGLKSDSTYLADVRKPGEEKKTVTDADFIAEPKNRKDWDRRRLSILFVPRPVLVRNGPSPLSGKLILKLVPVLFQGYAHQPATCSHPCLRKELLQRGFNRRLRNLQSVRNLFIGQTFKHEGKHLPFALGKP